VHHLKVANKFGYDNALHAEKVIYIPTSTANSSSRCGISGEPPHVLKWGSRSRRTTDTESFGLPSALIPSWEWCVHETAPVNLCSRPASHALESQDIPLLELASQSKYNLSLRLNEIELMMKRYDRTESREQATQLIVPV